jgi:hypothetical protein
MPAESLLIKPLTLTNHLGLLYVKKGLQMSVEKFDRLSP